MNQIPLKLIHTAIHTRENFLVSDANREAFSWVEQWPDWPSHCLIIYGAEGCGKTHLAQVWRQKTAGSLCSILEDIEGRDETELFHLFNRVKEENGWLLLTMRNSPAQAGFQLPDLASRLQSCPAIAVREPDDTLLKMLLIKLFSDRQLSVNSDVIDYILPRIERSFSAVHRLVEAVDSKAMAAKRNITIPLVREVL